MELLFIITIFLAYFRLTPSIFCTVYPTQGHSVPGDYYKGLWAKDRGHPEPSGNSTHSHTPVTLPIYRRKLEYPEEASMSRKTCKPHTHTGQKQESR